MIVLAAVGGFLIGVAVVVATLALAAAEVARRDQTRGEVAALCVAAAMIGVGVVLLSVAGGA